MSDKSRTRSRPHWRTAALGTLLGPGVFAAGLFGLAYALNPTNPFEVDGNADDNLGGGSDWAAELPLNGPDETFVIDQIPTVATERYFTGGGSKDDNAISQWRSTAGNPTPASRRTSRAPRALVSP